MKTIFALLLLVCSNAAFADTFKKIEISENGKQLNIYADNSQKITPPFSPGQVGFSKPLITADNETVGWLGMYPNCCTSYPIALSLAVLQIGKPVRRFSGDGRAIFAWCFLGNGAEVVFYQSALHGNTLRHFEHHRVADGKLLAVFDEEETTLEKPLPTWAHCLERANLRSPS